ncbi:deoxyguanosine kinase [Acrasis kona]|uniref:Deoxyguanosine kinase n=1 Tax=Acrasis kona TaxID=1008807 RepID=A0AAW2ZBV3_9EUKA
MFNFNLRFILISHHCNRGCGDYLNMVRASKIMKGMLAIVEGNISAGKTTLCRDLAKTINFKPYFEPHIENPWLEKFYNEPKKYAFQLQMFMLHHRFDTFKSAIKLLEQKDHNGVLLDRSIYSDWVFAKKNYDDGNISEVQFRQYLEVRQNMLQQVPIPDVTIYLDVHPEVCLHRIKNVRGIACESSIPIEYLEGLDSCYKVFLNEMRTIGSNVVIQDWNEFKQDNTLSHYLKKASS